MSEKTGGVPDGSCWRGLLGRAIHSHCAGAAALATAALLAWSGPAHGQVPSPTPDVALHQAGGVRAMARQADGKLLVGGTHVLVGKDIASGVLAAAFLHRQNPDGTVDLSFLPGPNGKVTAIALSSTHAYVAGDFDSIGGLPIARLAKVSLANGAVVADWNPAPDGDVTALLVDGSGNVLAAGTFGSIGGVAGRRVVKLDPATGAAVGAWNPAYPQALDWVVALATDGNNLFVGGGVSVDAAELHGCWTLRTRRRSRPSTTWGSWLSRPIPRATCMSAVPEGLRPRPGPAARCRWSRSRCSRPRPAP
jgi:hypothetical protein